LGRGRRVLCEEQSTSSQHKEKRRRDRHLENRFRKAPASAPHDLANSLQKKVHL
jgi:hypothetical protein